jgi:flavin reductase (DIM6/NTAB) family NADH-FMN oxidoreductase RutF
MKTAIRNLMRHVPSSVSIITVCAKHPGEQKAQVLPVGSAISSLTMVTLDPPHVSFNIKTPSRTLSAIREAGDSFRVHFLDDSLEAAKIAHNFTQGNSEQVLAERAHMFNFATDPTDESKSGPPRIVSSAVVASMNCRLVHEAFVADHVVAIARVEEFRSGEELKPTLLYHQGKYKKNTGSVLLDPQLHAKPIEKYVEPAVRDVTSPEPEGIRTP